MNPSENVRAESRGDFVRSNTSTVRTTAEMTDPVIAMANAAKITRKSRSASAAAYEAFPRPVWVIARLCGLAAPRGERFARWRMLTTMTTFAAQRQDLSTVRFAKSPAWETIHAVRTFVDPRARPYHESWHATIAREASRLDLALLFAINPRRGFVPDFLTPPPRLPAPRFEDQLAEIRATPPGQVALELSRCRDTVEGK